MSNKNQAPGGEVTPNSTTDFKGQRPSVRKAPATSPKLGRDPVQPNNRGPQGQG